MNNPDISIIITNYNYHKYLPRCIRSCLEQKNINIEIILIDDCSTEPHLMNYIEPYIKNITLIKNDINLGTPKTSMKAIRQSKSRYFLRLDADDYINEWTCFFLNKFLMSNKEYLGASCDYYYVNNLGEKLSRESAECKPIACGILYNKDKFLELGGYNENKTKKEEEEIRIRLGKKYNIINLKIPLYRYRMHDNNKTKSKSFDED